jgi:hypothetical protein
MRTLFVDILFVPIVRDRSAQTFSRREITGMKNHVIGLFHGSRH